ncbi:conjugative transposon protein TraJ [Belliella aquatica]|nr:conjugative transposon protein TraJ [Belliella aquatica]MCH7406848.1 conjugative transposon protein TraJ [Belliella aquatica]
MKIPQFKLFKIELVRWKPLVNRQNGLAFFFLFLLSPFDLFAQVGNNQIGGFHQVLDNLYMDMIPLSSQLIGVSRAIAGFAAIFYIGSRVWKHIAQAETVDFYPLLRPFALGLAILLFPSVLALMNGILQPVANVTNAMVVGTNSSIAELLAEKKRIQDTGFYGELYPFDDGVDESDLYYKYANPEEESNNSSIIDRFSSSIRMTMERVAHEFKTSIKRWMSEILQVLFMAASLAINTIRTFYLIVLAILGPLVFGLAVFDGFQQTLNNWIARYINVFMWLPVANIFGAIIAKIQENMLRIDLAQLGNEGKTFFSQADTAYLIFMVIAIIGYFTVPSVANYIISPGGRDSLLHKATGMAMAAPIVATKLIK